MAGFYPDVPGNRIAYDADGTAVFLNDTEVSPSNVRIMNDETNSEFNTGISSGSISFFFPRPMNIVGLRASSTAYIFSPGGALYVSQDATNFSDGTWTPVGTGYYGNAGFGSGLYRTAISSVSFTNIRAVRLDYSAAGGPSTILGVHMYGSVTAGANPDRLEIWHPTLAQRVGGAYFDWGDVPRTSSADRTFRVKNLSTTLTASSVSIGAEALTDTTPSVPGQHLFSTDGVNFYGSVSIGDLAPGAVSAPITVRRSIPSTATLGLWALRIRASAVSWA